MGYGAGKREGHAHLADMHPYPHLREASDRACRKALVTTSDSTALSRAIRELSGGGGWVRRIVWAMNGSAPPRKIRVQFHGYKHTWLILLGGEVVGFHRRFIALGCYER